MGRLQYAVLNLLPLLDYRSTRGIPLPNTRLEIPSAARTRPAMHSLTMFCMCNLSM